MKPLLVGWQLGDNAPEGTAPFSADGPGSGRRLAALLGLEDVREIFDTVNLWPHGLEDVVRAIAEPGRPYVLLAGSSSVTSVPPMVGFRPL